MRAVTSATAAAILQIDRKTLDNILLRLGPEAVPPGRQGVERRIPIGLLEDLILARDLSAGLGIPMREAFNLARRILNRTADGLPDLSAEFIGSLPVGAYCQLGANLAQLRQDLQQRVEEAVETVVRRPRGRPRKGASRDALPSVLGDA